MDVGAEILFKCLDVVVGDVVHGAVCPGVDRDDLIFDGVRYGKILLEEFGEPLSSEKLHLG